MTNSLIHSTSPYLLQHAQNPVNWFPWCDETLEIARAENKLIIVSIGYSACHWCHVMEHESFEDEKVATLMNAHFICIKVDREERPDIDAIYMTALQLMTGAGGWPLNCICLPDERPIYGGTYFPKDDWMALLKQLAQFYRDKPDEAASYAKRLHEGIRQADLIPKQEIPTGSYTRETVEAILNPWYTHFDYGDGGHNRAPKFPLPNNFLFLLRSAALLKDDRAHIILRLTLNKMAFGGIYDQLGGGFARYSVDSFWFVPHFEKMLYDNAQLVSLYAEAYQYCKEPLYREVVEETLAFIARELSSPEGGFYSALDADSEGIEGAFYCWTMEEIRSVLHPEMVDLFARYYNMSEKGNWEETNILHRQEEDEAIAEQVRVELKKLKEHIRQSKSLLMAARETRVRPGLDDKILTAWNALMIKGYVDAYRALGTADYLTIAERNATFLLANLTTKDGGLMRSYKAGKAGIKAFLDDYAYTADALIALYQVTFNESYLQEAKALLDYVILHFDDQETGLFFYSDDQDKALIARTKETTDSVTPASNSVIAQVLQKLGAYYQEENYKQRADQALANVADKIKTYPSGYSNWAMLLLDKAFPPYEIAISGPNPQAVLEELDQTYIPNKLLIGTTNSTLPLAKGKEHEERMIYVCTNSECLPPVKTAEEALRLMNNRWPTNHR